MKRKIKGGHNVNKIGVTWNFSAICLKELDSKTPVGIKTWCNGRTGSLKGSTVSFIVGEAWAELESRWLSSLAWYQTTDQSRYYAMPGASKTGAILFRCDQTWFGRSVKLSWKGLSLRRETVRRRSSYSNQNWNPRPVGKYIYIYRLGETLDSIQLAIQEPGPPK